MAKEILASLCSFAKSANFPPSKVFLCTVDTCSYVCACIKLKIATHVAIPYIGKFLWYKIFKDGSLSLINFQGLPSSYH